MSGGIVRNLCLQMVHQPIVEWVSQFGCESKFPELVARHSTPESVSESVGRGAIEIL